MLSNSLRFANRTPHACGLVELPLHPKISTRQRGEGNHHNQQQAKQSRSNSPQHEWPSRFASTCALSNSDAYPIRMGHVHNTHTTPNFGSITPRKIRSGSLHIVKINVILMAPQYYRAGIDPVTGTEPVTTGSRLC